MNELEDILNYLETTSLEPHDDYTSEFSYKKQKILWSYIKELQRENQELKKQLANNEIVMTCENCEWFGVCPHSYKEYDYKKECEELKNQQKEFIEWLEKESKELIRDAGYHQRICLDIIEKYKEIIGDKDE